MKNTRVSTAALASALLLSALAMGARQVKAQIVDIVKVNLPFNATIAGNPLPAGEYTIQSANEMNGSPILMFRSDKGKTVEVLARLISRPDNSAAHRTEIVLEERGNERNLVKLWIEGEANGYEFGTPGRLQ